MSDRGEKRIVLGNEAIARGVVESGCQFFAAYPGTPSSEILPAIVCFKKENKLDIYIEWSTNEKAAFENALGASYAGKRAAVAMKQVGLNVASDALMSAAYLGTIGGFVVISCDDPGPFSSQTEQDTRFMAMFAKVPVFDPANPREAQQMLPVAFDVSEKYQIPVILRPVLRVSHAQQTVIFNPIREVKRKANFHRDPQRWSVTPRCRSILHNQLNVKLQKIAEEFNSMTFLNFVENDREKAVLGIIAGGIGYAITREIIIELGLQKEIPILKVGTPFPFPNKVVEAFIEKCDQVLILEETEPVIELQIRDKSKITGRLDGRIPNEGEMLPEVITQVISDLCKKFSISVGEAASTAALEKLVAGLGLPIRRPTLCSGCPHRASFFAIKKAFPNGIFPSDIGCYVLGVNMEAVDTSHDMGAAITFASGLYQAYHQDGKEIPIIATIGDSTFYHSGAPGLLNAVYNGARFVLVILDNSVTAMTGMQPTPESGTTADGHPGHSLSLQELVKGCGVKYLRVVSPYDIKGMIRQTREAYEYTKQPEGGIAVLISRYPCINSQKEILKVNPIKIEIRHIPLLENGLTQVKMAHLPKSFLPVYHDMIAPCTGACPIQVDVRGYIGLVLKGKYEEALALIREKNPFPRITGRICSHPCQDVCRRKDVDQTVAINDLKRFVSDIEKEDKTELSVPEENGKKVAIIGAGPAGLMAAFTLRKMGYSVTIFEALPVAGGMLAVGIPEYRLPRKVLNEEIDYLLKVGVELKLNSPIGPSLALQDLKSMGYAAIFISTGAHQSMKLGLEGEESKGILHAINFLKRVILGELVNISKKVVVIGGGNSAIDAARTALRIGAKEITIVYRRTRAEMPAQEQEIEDAEQEGIQIEELTTPTRMLVENDVIKGMECIRMELGDLDESGRPRPIPIPGSEFKIEAETVILALGQSPDLSFISQTDGIRTTSWGGIQVDSLTLETSVRGIFAGGDVVTGPLSYIDAMGAGRKAAVSIQRYLSGEDMKTNREEKGVSMELHFANTDKIEPQPKMEGPVLSVESRKKNFKEVHLPLSEEVTMTEAKRCLHCGACYHCDTCTIQCPEGAISKTEDGYVINYEKCSGCRICVLECPTSAIDMPAVGACIACGFCLKRFECPSLLEGEDGRVTIDRLTCVDCGLCVQVCGQGGIVQVSSP